MNHMFYCCKTVLSINVSGFDTSKVTDMYSMFYNCTQLVGGSGTTYSASNENDLTYAHIDEGQTNPGYLTYKQSTAPAPTNNSTSTTSSVSGNQSTSLSGMQAIAKAKKGTTIIFGILVFILSGIIIWRIKKLIKK